MAHHYDPNIITPGRGGSRDQRYWPDFELDVFTIQTFLRDKSLDKTRLSDVLEQETGLQQGPVLTNSINRCIKIDREGHLVINEDRLSDLQTIEEMRAEKEGRKPNLIIPVKKESIIEGSGNGREPRGRRTTSKER